MFFHHGSASLAKSIVYYGLAKTSQSQQEYIPAVITAYYSLFHLTIALMYFCPHYLKSETRTDFETAIRKGDDPTNKISHKSALKYLKEMQMNGLPSKISHQFDLGKTLREHVNYAPRIRLDGLDAIFGTCQYGTSDYQAFVSECDYFIIESIKWALANPLDPNQYLLHIALQKVSDFLTQPDLGYSEWITDTSKKHAMNKLKDLQLLVKTEV
jgi:hypothetical protein